MTKYVFQPQAPVTVPVAGSDVQFPVRRGDGVGRTYAARARAMG
ncbi:5-carboxymethyl-2-hydroxymuconate isomerase, partial [Salmonella enterica subsp. enterica serovar Poona]